MDLDFKNPYSRTDKKYKPTPFIGPSSRQKPGNYVSHYSDKIIFLSIAVSFTGLYVVYFLMQTVLFYTHLTNGCTQPYDYYIPYVAFYCRSDEHPFESAVSRAVIVGISLICLLLIQAIIIRLSARYKKSLPPWVTVIFFLLTPLILFVFIYLGYVISTN